MTPGTAPPGVPLRAEPRLGFGNSRILHRGSENCLKRSGETPALRGVKAGELPGRVNPRPPENLVGEHVAEPGDDALIHEGRLQAPAVPLQAFRQPGAVQPEGIRTLPTENCGDLLVGLGDPQATELALVAIYGLPVSISNRTRS